MPDGSYQVGFAMPDASEELASRPEFAIRCANPLEFKDGVNWLGMEVCYVSCANPWSKCLLPQ